MVEPGLIGEVEVLDVVQRDRSKVLQMKEYLRVLIGGISSGCSAHSALLNVPHYSQDTGFIHGRAALYE